jgi:ankyrin repeat protein
MLLSQQMAVTPGIAKGTSLSLRFSPLAGLRPMPDCSTPLPDGGDAMVPAKRTLLLVPLIYCAVAFAGTPALASDLTDALKARDVDQVRRLLAAGANVNEKVQRDYPLNVAATFGPAEMVAMLLDAGADIEKPGRDGLHPLHNAVAMGHREIVAQLVEKGANVNSTDRLGRTPLITFANNGGEIGIAKMLLAAGADPKSEDVDRMPALNVAAQIGNLELGELLIAGGADINHRDMGGESPLIAAVFHKRHDFVRMLIAHGVDVNLKSKSGVTPLKWAANDVAMQKLLIEAGAK